MAVGRGNYEVSRGQGGRSYGDFKGRLHVKEKFKSNSKEETRD